jgi:hypothetical protein
MSVAGLDVLAAPDWPMPVPDFTFPVASELAPGDGADEPGWGAGGVGFELGMLLPDPVAGALPVLPVLLPLLWPNAGAIIAATIPAVTTIANPRDATVPVLLAADGAIRSVLDSRPPGRTPGGSP